MSAGINGYKTNHSLRATAATRLYQAGVDEQLIMEKTGHRSLEGMRSYKRTNTVQQENISDILSLTKKPAIEQPSAIADSSSTGECSVLVPGTNNINTFLTTNACLPSTHAPMLTFTSISIELELNITYYHVKPHNTLTALLVHASQIMSRGKCFL